MLFKLLHNILTLYIFYKYITKNNNCYGPNYEPYHVVFITYGIFFGYFLKQIKNYLY